MINLVIIGTIGLDTIETPFGKVEGVLGGSGAYASLAASYFSCPGLCSIIGKDFPVKHRKYFQNLGIDDGGVTQGKKTFRWSGAYEYDMNEASTLKTELNSLSEFKPQIPDHFSAAKYLFLANIDPDLQLEVLKKMPKSFILADTMNFWIKNKRKELIEVIKRVNLLLLNDGEARQLFDTPNLVLAARKVLALGPRYVIIKKGEHGALLFSKKSHFSAPGFPIEQVKDPTGAGDSFAGGLIGYLSSVAKSDEKSIRKGIIFGSAIASFCAENFGVSYRKKIALKDVKKRYQIFNEIRSF